MNELGKELRKIRLLAGFEKIEDIAKVCNTSERSVSNYERGERLPGIDYLAAFSKATKSNLIELVKLRIQSTGETLPEALVAREDVVEYRAQPDEIGALRIEIRLAELPLDWSLLLMQLVSSSDLTAAGARQLIDFIQDQQP